MSQITRVPWGLQGFLGSKNFGDNPSELGQVVAPTLDMARFLGVENDKWYKSNSAVFAAPNTTSFNVPDGELWFVKRWTGRVTQTTPTAGDSIHVQFLVDDIPNSNSGAQAHPTSPRLKIVNENGIGTSIATGYDFTEPLLCWPGTFIKWEWDDFLLTAGNWSAVSCVNYDRIEI